MSSAYSERRAGLLSGRVLIQTIESHYEQLMFGFLETEVPNK